MSASTRREAETPARVRETLPYGGLVLNLQYILAGRTWVIAAITLLAWYWAAPYWLEAVIPHWHSVLEDVWLVLLSLIVGLWAWLVERAVRKERRHGPPNLIPPGASDPVWIWVARLERVRYSSRLVERRGRWMASRLRRCGDLRRKVSLAHVPRLWLRQPGFWLRLLAAPALAVWLAGPGGAWMAEGLPLPLPFSSASANRGTYLIKAEVCPDPCHDADWELLPLAVWPGGSVAIGGLGTEIPSAGWLKLQFRNQPRTRRRLSITAGPGVWLAASQGQQGREIEVTVYGCRVELRYAVAEANRWGVWFDKMEYRTQGGRTLERITFSARQRIVGMPLIMRDLYVVN